MRGLLGILISALCFALFVVVAYLLTPVIGGAVVRALAHSSVPAWLRDEIVVGLIVVAALCVFVLGLAFFGDMANPRGTPPLSGVGTGRIAGATLFLFTWAVVTAAVTVLAYKHLPAARMGEDTLRLTLLAVAVPVFSLGFGALLRLTFLATRRPDTSPCVAGETEPKQT